jgi:hypothetical protein
MSEHRPRRQPNAGAFLGPDIAVPVPSVLVDQEGSGPEQAAAELDVERSPHPRRGILQRIVDRLRGSPSRQRPER